MLCEFSVSLLVSDPDWMPGLFQSTWGVKIRSQVADFFQCNGLKGSGHKKTI